MSVETDPLACYVVVGRTHGANGVHVHGPFAFRELAERWAVERWANVAPDMRWIVRKLERV